MPRLLVNTPQGNQEELQLGVGGSYFDPSRIVWCWDGHGEPPVKIDLGYMERVEREEPLTDDNGKQLYAIIKEGEHKNTARKVPLRKLVIYLRNKKLGKMKPSLRPPKVLPPE